MLGRTRCGAQAGANVTKQFGKFVSLVLAVGLIAATVAHGPAAKDLRFAQATPEFEVVKGRWVRPDGGYIIIIKGIDSIGRMDAAYFNPKPINVSKAEVTVQGRGLKVFVELSGAGYPGSTYTLTYEPRSDTLTGIYFQAVMQQQFDVIFQRMKVVPP